MRRAILLTLALLAAGPALAAGDTGGEVAHLLGYIESSTCTFVRNGASADGKDARGHVERKYRYFRSRITTAEDFIRLAASGSTVSGEPYRVRCAGREQPAAAWLSEELARLRRGQR